MKKRYLLIGLAVLLSTLLFGAVALADPPTAISLDKTAYEFELAYGSKWVYPGIYSSEMKVTITPSDAEYAYLRITSSNAAIADAGQTYLHGKEVGSTQVTVQAVDENGKVLIESAAATVTFKEVPVTEIVFDTAYQSDLQKLSPMYGSFDLTDCVTVLPANATYDKYDMTWTSSDPNVARVTKYGDLYPQNPGAATITGTSKGAAPKTVTFQVKVVTDPITSITFTPDSFILQGPGDSLNLFDYVTVTPDTPTGIINSKVRSSDNKVVKVDGMDVEAVGIGEATVTVTVTNYDGTEVQGVAKFTVKEIPVTGLSFAKAEYKEKYGASFDLSKELDYTPGNASLEYMGEYDILWESSDEGIATVDNYGKVDFYEPGSVEITAKAKHDETIVAKTKVTAEPVAVKKVSVNKTKLTYEYGTSEIISSKSVRLTVEPKNAYVKEITIVSSDPEMVDDYDISYYSGNKFGIYPFVNTGKAGTTTLTVKVDDGISVMEATFDVEVSIKQPKLELRDAYSGEVLTSKTLYLKKDAEANKQVLRVIAEDVNDYYDNELKVTWKSSNTKVATVDKRGNVTIKKAGSAKITATSKADATVSASCKITVKKVLIKKLEANKKITLRVGEEANLYSYITFTPEKTNQLFNTKLSFKSKKSDIASVNANGKIVGNAVGSTEITVKAQDGSKKTVKITVKVIKEQE